MKREYFQVDYLGVMPQSRFFAAHAHSGFGVASRTGGPEMRSAPALMRLAFVVEEPSRAASPSAII